MRRGVGATLLMLTLVVASWQLPSLLPPAEAVVLYARNEALKLIFPEADRIEPKALFLTRNRPPALKSLPAARWNPSS